MQDGRKAVCNILYVSMAFFPSLKHNFIAYRSSKVSSRPDCIFEIHQLWQSGFNRVYSNSWSSCSFEPEIVKIGQSSHKMYSNNLLNFQESTTTLNACTKKCLETWLPYVYWSFVVTFVHVVENSSPNVVHVSLSFYVTAGHDCQWPQMRLNRKTQLVLLSFPEHRTSSLVWRKHGSTNLRDNFMAYGVCWFLKICVIYCFRYRVRNEAFLSYKAIFQT